MKQFKFSLEKYRGTSSRHICPNCGKKEFVRYVNNETEEYLEEYVGKCNRIEKCGYHYTPKQYFDDKGEKVQFFTRKNVHVEEKSTYYYNEKLVLDSLHSDTKKSNLYQFLIQYFHEEKVKNTFKKYLVGVSNFWKDAVIFWQIDRDFKVRSGKVMQYDLITGNILRSLIITEINKDGFQYYMKSIGKLGGQNKVPRLSNNREIADEFYKLNLIQRN